MLIIGHRGAMGHAPENTMASFKKAAAMGVDAVECDVHLSKDGRLVVMHDESLARTTGRNALIKRTSWAAIARLDAGSWFHGRFRGERPPSLPALLRWARARRGLKVVVEIKNERVKYPGIAEKVVRALRAARMTERAIVISFDHAVVRRVKRLAPEVFAGILFAERLPRMAERLAWSGADALFPRHTLVTKAFMKEARRIGAFVGTWTANAPADIRRLAGLGVDAAAGNYPERLKRHAGRR